MAGESGYKGKVLVGASQVAEVTGWSLNPTANNPAWASSSIPGFKQRVKGVRDCTGTFDFKYDTSDKVWATIKEGDEVTLNLYLNDTDFIVVPAVVDGLTCDVDVNDGEVTGGTCSFSQTDEITYP